MNKQSFFYISQNGNQLWVVTGPVKANRFIGQFQVEMSDGNVVEIRKTYHTKGGACKECHKRNYLIRAQGGKDGV